MHERRGASPAQIFFSFIVLPIHFTAHPKEVVLLSWKDPGG